MQFEAKTVEEAINEGLSHFGITETEAEVTVIEKPVRGLFGRMKGKAIVEVVKKESEKKNEAEFLRKVLSFLDVEAEVKVTEDGENEILTLVTTEKTSSVIGYRGEVLDAMQTLTGAVANIGKNNYRKVVVDCENYRDKREETLIKLAKRLEEKATEMRREVYLEPMNPFERRIIHTALADSATVTTRSDGKEPSRYVVIVPNDKDETARPYNAGKRNFKNGGTKPYGNHGDRNNRNGGNRGGTRPYGNRGRGGRSGSGFSEEKRKAPSGFGTYLGNSLKDKQ